ncbi:Cdc25 phosphatase Ibp1 [Savitreella phatthalungensis]
MSSSLVPAITTITPPALASLLRDPVERRRTVVVDVRDDDGVGGHVRGAERVPSRKFYDHVQRLVRTYDDPDRVGEGEVRRIVFHCSLSQQRGPKAARAFREARELVKKPSRDGETPPRPIDIMVLEGGFVNWHSCGLAEDESLTEGFDREHWKHGYQG